MGCLPFTTVSGGVIARCFTALSGATVVLNALALIIVAAGIAVGSVLENSVLIACLTAAGTVIKGWNDFKKFSFKIDMCRFAYTTYDKTLIELRTYVRGLPDGGVRGIFESRCKPWTTQSLISHPQYLTSAFKNTNNDFATITSIKAVALTCEW